MSLLNILNLWPPFNTSNMSAYDSVWHRCLLAVQTQIKSLNLADIDASSVVVQKVPWARDFTNGVHSFPGVVICPWHAEDMNPLAGTNRRDDVGYPVLVSIVAKDNQDLTGNLSSYLLWREKIARHFRNQRLAGVPEIIKTIAAPMSVVLPEAFVKGVFHSAFVFRFISREVRG
jgi:hypothetical protein